MVVMVLEPTLIHLEVVLVLELQILVVEALE